MLLVALVKRPHGLAGEVSVEVLTTFPERFVPGSDLEWIRGSEKRSLRLSAARPHAGRWLLRFEGVDDVEAARALAGGELAVPESDAYPAPEGSYYSHRIRGFRCEDRRRRSLGIADGLEQTAAGPLLTVTTPAGKEVLVPFVAAIVVEVDDAERRIVLDPPEGLFEL
jgi:16S rRNA processing protein RimM